MESRSSKKLLFQVINTKKTLDDTILFLQDGFDWRKENSYLLKYKLHSINSGLDSHGVIIKADERIVGAILFFHQGYLGFDSDKRPIINLSSWYINEKYRGLPTISLLRFMIDKLNHSIITNYSANEAASKILLAVGFKKMGLRRASIYFHQSILYRSKIKIREISRNAIKFNNNLNVELQEGTGISYLSVETNREEVQLIVKKKLFRRSLFGIKFNMRTLLVIWSSDDMVIADNWGKVSYKLLAYTKCMKLICDFSNNNFPKISTETHNDYLIFPNDDDLLPVQPFQSEMNIFE